MNRRYEINLVISSTKLPQNLVYAFIAFSSLKCTKNFPTFSPLVLPKYFVYPVIHLFTLNCNYLFLFVFSPKL